MNYIFHKILPLTIGIILFYSCNSNKGSDGPCPPCPTVDNDTVQNVNGKYKDCEIVNTYAQDLIIIERSHEKKEPWLGDDNHRLKFKIKNNSNKTAYKNIEVRIDVVSNTGDILFSIDKKFPVYVGPGETIGNGDPDNPNMFLVRINRSQYPEDFDNIDADTKDHIHITGATAGRFEDDL